MKSPLLINTVFTSVWVGAVLMGVAAVRALGNEKERGL